MFALFRKTKPKQQLATTWLQQHYGQDESTTGQKRHELLEMACRARFADWNTMFFSKILTTYIDQVLPNINAEVDKYITHLLAKANASYAAEMQRLDASGKILAMTDEELLNFWLNADEKELKELAYGMF